MNTVSYAKLSQLFMLASCFGLSIAPAYSFEVFDNDLIRFGTGSEDSVNANGTLQQPFYYDTMAASWYQLTFSNYPLDAAIAVDGDGSNAWNTNGTIQANYTLTGQVIDISDFTAPTPSTGYGTIVSTGTVSIAGKTLEVKNTYTLQADKSFITSVVEVTNTSGVAVNNLRVWVGTRDDYVGLSDQPTKERGNLVDDAFELLTDAADQAVALRIRTAESGVLFYSTSDNAQISIDSCCSFSNAYGQDPATAPITETGDGSYALYIRMADLADGESDSFTWYYAAGQLADLDDIVTDVAIGSDADGDGISDSEEAADADNDGIPDYLDPADNPNSLHGGDSDGDGIPDIGECPRYPDCADTDGDTIPDYLDPDNATLSNDVEAVTTSNTGIGSLGIPFLAGLAGMILLLRQKKLASFLLLSLCIFNVSAAELPAAKLQSNSGVYAGFSMGLSSLEPDVSGTIFDINDHSGPAAGVLLGYRFNETIQSELSLMDLGDAELSTTGTNVGSVDYRVINISGIYRVYNFTQQGYPVTLHLKAGYAKVNNSSDVPYNKTNDGNLSTGLFAQFALDDTASLRLGLDSFGEDSAFLGISIVVNTR